MTRKLLSWEALLLFILIVVVLINVSLSPFYLGLNNQINLFQLSIEKIIVALAMTLIIINAEIDLSVASVMGLSAGLLAYLHNQGQPFWLAIVASLLVGALAGAFNGFWIAYVGLPSLVVTLAGLIGYRGVASILIEDESIGNFPAWFESLGQQGLVGPIPFALLLFFVGVVVVWIVLQRSAYGRTIYVIGNSADVARYSGVNVKRVKMSLFIISGVVSALAGILIAARLGAVRGSTAVGFELDIITMVLLGGVSIFGGSGTLTGVVLSILIILNIRNGLSLVNIPGNTQTGVIGLLLILSVLIPNWLQTAQTWWSRDHQARAQAKGG
ncbi:MAG: ABC transporter permease [Ardenticatenaceae bacterium]|nr:ABC transporter permease [Ardenticatenaceae bacterium]